MLGHSSGYLIRPLAPTDEPILWEMLYQALHIAEGEQAPARDIIRRPEFARYVEHWGGAGDAGFLAWDANQTEVLGAVWCRAMDESSPPEAAPELAFVVRSGHRRRGIGEALLTQWVRANPQQDAVRLRVASGNPAVRLYERFGFRLVAEGEGSVTLRRDA